MSTTSSPAFKLRERLAGPLAAAFGDLPKLQLPSDDNPLHHFASEMASLLRDKGIYRRDTLLVLPYQGKKRLEPITPVAFRSFAARHVWTYKIRFDRDGSPFDVGKSMTKDEASAVLESWDFWPAIPEIETVLSVPVPRFKPDGTITLTSPGYDPESLTYTFPPD